MDDNDTGQNGGEISDIIRDILKNRGWEAKVREQGVLSVWDEVVGERIAKNSLPKKINRGSLVVITRNPTWTQQLTMMKEKIIDRLNEKLNDDIVKEIRFIQGEIPEESDDSSVKKGAPPGAPPLKEDLKRLEKLTGDIENEELKEAVSSLLKERLPQQDDE